jgi:hypothetical protein
VILLVVPTGAGVFESDGASLAQLSAVCVEAIPHLAERMFDLGTELADLVHA